MPKQDLILVIILIIILLWIGISYVLQRSKSDRKILEKLKTSRSKFSTENVSIRFKYDLKGSIFDSTVYFRNRQIIIVARKSSLLFPNYNNIYLIGKSTEDLPKELFENQILIDKLKENNNLLIVEGFFKTGKVVYDENEPTDGNFIQVFIPINLKSEAIKSLLLECDLSTAVNTR